MAGHLCVLCGVRAVTFWRLDSHGGFDRELCGHHANDRGPSMIAAGWRMSRDERDTLLPTLGPVTGDMRTH